MFHPSILPSHLLDCFSESRSSIWNQGIPGRRMATHRTKAGIPATSTPARRLSATRQAIGGLNPAWIHLLQCSRCFPASSASTGIRTSRLQKGLTQNFSSSYPLVHGSASGKSRRASARVSSPIVVSQASEVLLPNHPSIPGGSSSSMSSQVYSMPRCFKRNACRSIAHRFWLAI